MRVIAGPEKKTRVMSEKERLVTAYHEMGHAIVAHYLENSRPGPQDLGGLARAGARLHDLPADRGQVPDDPRGAVGHDGDDARRPRRGGARLRRGDDRRVQRPREGHRHREADGHALRHVREARPARVRPRPRPAVPGPRVLVRAGLLRRRRARDRLGDPPHRRGGAPAGPLDPRAAPRQPRRRPPRSCSGARRSSATSSSACSRASRRKRSSGRTSRSSRSRSCRAAPRLRSAVPRRGRGRCRAPASPAARRRCAAVTTARAGPALRPSAPLPAASPAADRSSASSSSISTWGESTPIALGRCADAIVHALAGGGPVRVSA